MGFTKDAFVALGANLPSEVGAPAQTLAAALAALERPGLRVVRCSRFYNTPCFPPGAGPDYVNAVAALDSGLAAADLLDWLHAIEARFARRRDIRWGMRTLDLDLLALGDVVLPDAPTLAHWITLPPDQQRSAAPDRLILPHPRLQDRAFVLVPFAEIAPEWTHPTLGLTVRAMRNALPLPDLAAVVPVL